MKLSLTTMLDFPIKLSTEEGGTASAIYINSQNGKILSLGSQKGFLSAEYLHIHEQNMEFTGEISEKRKGDDWMTFSVQNRAGKKRGKVSEIWIESSTFAVLQIECVKGFLGLFSEKRVFAVENIFKVLPRKKLIIVEEEARVFQKTSKQMEEFRPVPALKSID